MIALSIFLGILATSVCSFPITGIKSKAMKNDLRAGKKIQAIKTSTIYNDDTEAISAFGTKKYWDEVYSGMGDFPKDEYSWYYGYGVIKPYIVDTVAKESKILCPGIGNEPILLDLYGSGYKNLVAFDYSQYAVERQRDLLSYQPNANIELYQMDARRLRKSWTNKFDTILEKGALDSIYLSGDGNIEAAIEELGRVLKPGGIIISISAVIPNEKRRNLFRNFDWIRDGSDDLQAGCFILKNKTSSLESNFPSFFAES